MRQNFRCPEKARADNFLMISFCFVAKAVRSTAEAACIHRTTTGWLTKKRVRCVSRTRFFWDRVKVDDSDFYGLFLCFSLVTSSSRLVKVRFSMMASISHSVSESDLPQKGGEKNLISFEKKRTRKPDSLRLYFPPSEVHQAEADFFQNRIALRFQISRSNNRCCSSSSRSHRASWDKIKSV